MQWVVMICSLDFKNKPKIDYCHVHYFRIFPFSDIMISRPCKHLVSIVCS